MAGSTVSVFGASGRQGQAQVRHLLAEGHRARAVSRNPGIFTGPGFAGAEVLAADYADPGSLDRACAGVDAVFFQPPQTQDPRQVLAHVRALAAAVGRARVDRLVLNSTMWAPDRPCGQPLYDQALAIEDICADACAAAGVPLTVFRPTVYMDNWLSGFAKPVLVREHVYRYPHKPDLRFTPISLRDVAKFMVAALDRPDLAGERLRIAGPEALGPQDIAGALSAAMGVPIAYEYISPRDFGLFVYELIGRGTGLDREAYADVFADFYTFNNDAPQQPFRFDVAPLLRRVPLRLETFADWAKDQDWWNLDEAVGSTSG
jgi:uncharacterized protein YbjT (DUF2867 family)